jgi:hypothetical protein
MVGRMEDRYVSDVVYLYGFVPAGTLAPPAGSVAIVGVGDAAVEAIHIDAITAIVSRVPAALFAPDTLAERLEDIAWVGEQGLAHERVVLWFVDHADILPARMFSLYGSADALRTAVSPRTHTIAAQLQVFRGRREWNLKVAYDATELARHAGEVSEEVHAIDEEIAGAAPGRRYLLERKRNDMLKGAVTRAARRLADELLDTLAAHAERTRRLPLAATDDQGNVVLHAALLVSTDAEPALRASAEQEAAAKTALGLIVSFSGPWAPYRFLEDDG